MMKAKSVLELSDIEMMEHIYLETPSFFAVMRGILGIGDAASRIEKLERDIRLYGAKKELERIEWSLQTISADRSHSTDR